MVGSKDVKRGSTLTVPEEDLTTISVMAVVWLGVKKFEQGFITRLLSAIMPLAYAPSLPIVRQESSACLQETSNSR